MPTTDDNPAEDRRTEADRLWDAPKIIWWGLGILVLVAFFLLILPLHESFR